MRESYERGSGIGSGEGWDIFGLLSESETEVSPGDKKHKGISKRPEEVVALLPGILPKFALEEILGRDLPKSSGSEISTQGKDAQRTEKELAKVLPGMFTECQLEEIFG